MKNCCSGEKDNKVDRILLPCQLQGKEGHIIALLDTGSQISIISKRFVPKSKIRLSDISVTAANDKEIPIMGKTVIQLIIGKLVINAKVYVAKDLTEDLLIGMRFLWRNKADLSCSTKKFSIGPKNNREHFVISSDKKVGTVLANAHAIRAEKETFLKPGEGLRYNIFDDVRVRGNDDFLKKNSIDFEVLDYGKRKKIFMFNLSDKNRLIRKGQILATIKGKNKRINSIFKGCNQINEKENISNLPVLVNVNELKVESLCDNEGNKIKIETHNDEPEHLNKKAFNGIKKRLGIFTSEMRLAKTPPGTIEVTDDLPIKRRNYKLGVIERQELRKIINRMEEKGLIRRETSPYESPCFLKLKPSGDWRLLVDYRKVNEKILKNNDRVPRVEEIWTALRDMKYFTTLDLNQGFFQLPLDEKSKKYTGINVGGVGYVFNCVPQGLSASPCIFQKVMTDIFHDLLFVKCIVYLDDIVIFGKTLEEVIKNTEEVLDRLAKYDLKVKASKCKFYGKEVNLLGQKISFNKMEPNPKNIDPILKAPRPTTIKQLQSFIGAANYHRSYIKNFAKLTAPLTDLLQKDKDEPKNKGSAKLKRWTEIEQKAFEAIKQALASEPVRVPYDPKAKTLLEVDASKTALGAVLLQIDRKTNEKHPVAYFSQKVPLNKKHLCPFDQEMNAITNACEFFREYLLGIKFTIYTDHQPLVFQARFHKPSPRLARLVSKLGEFTFNIKHIKGKDNHTADFLSRADEEDEIEFKQGQFTVKNKNVNAVTRSKSKTAKQAAEDAKNELFELIDNKNKILNKNKEKQKEKEVIDSDILREKQNSDHFWKNMIAYIQGGKIENCTRNEKNQICKTADQFMIDPKTKVLYKKNPDAEYFKAVPVIPNSEIEKVLHLLHENRTSGGHFGYKKTLQKVKQRVFFHKMPGKVKNYVLSCHECQIYMDKPTKLGKLKPMPIQNFKPMKHIQIDFTGPFKTNHEKKYVIVGIDKSTKYCFAKPTRESDGRTTIKFLKEIINHQGRPDKITCDNGRHFLNKEVHDFCEEKGIKILHSTSYSPQTQGQVERMNGVLKKCLAKYNSCDSEEWDNHVREAALVYNLTPIQGLKNRTPFYLMHGYEGTPPTKLGIPQPKNEDSREKQIEQANKAREEIPKLDQLNAEKYSKQYNKNRKLLSFETNDLVLLKNQKLGKGLPKFFGPFRVVKKISDLNYTVRIIKENGDEKDDTIHIRRLMKYNPRKNCKLPEKIDEKELSDDTDEIDTPQQIKRGRGRPRKNPIASIEDKTDKIKKKRGRPKKEVHNKCVTKIVQQDGTYIKHIRQKFKPNPYTTDSEYYSEWEYIPIKSDRSTFWRRGPAPGEWTEVQPLKKDKYCIDYEADLDSA